MGVGANRQTNILGASGWFDWERTQQTTTGTEIHGDGIGDFNYELEECDPVLPEITITGTSVLECDEEAVFEVCLSTISPVDVVIGYQTVDGSAIAPGDYQAVSNGELTIPAGQLCGNITITVVDDGRRENPENFSVELTSASGATIAVDTAVGSIEDCESDPQVSTVDLTVNECTGLAEIKVELDSSAKEPIDITFMTRDTGSATEDVDYEGRSGTITIATGETTGYIRIVILEDDVLDDGETFEVVLTGANGAVIIDDVAVVTIEDCPPKVPTISIRDASESECNGPMVFLVCLSEVSDTPVEVQYTTLNETAEFGFDYEFAQATLTIPADTLCVEIEVTLLTDTDPNEGDETFLVTLSNADGAIIDDGQAVGTILDCDPEPMITIRDTSAEECDGVATFQICVSPVSDQPITVDFATSDGTAIQPGDYVSNSGTITIPANVECVTLDVVVNDDGVEEAVPETFVVTLSNPTGASIEDGEGVGTITDCDQPPTLEITGKTVSECDEEVVLNVCLSETSDSDVSVDFATGGGNAIPGTDYIATSGTLVIPANQLCGTITIQLLNDQVVEPTDKTFNVTLSNPQGATIETGEATVTIEDCTDPNEDPTIMIEDPDLVKECEVDSIVFTVCLSEASDEVVTVLYETQDGTAVAGSDYVAASGTITFNPNEGLKQQIVIAIIQDEDEEQPEQFQIVLSNPSNATIEDGTAVATIQDCEDDPTAIELLSFNVEQDGLGGVVLSWNTASEFETAGFDLHRASMADSESFEMEKITESMILAQGSTGEGAEYTYSDRPGFGRYVYQLEEVELDGHTERKGTVAIDVAPKIERIEMSEAGVVLHVPVMEDWSFVIEACESFGAGAEWSPVAGQSGDTGRVVDPAGSPGRFYRLIATKK